MAILTQTRLLICNDSAPSHLAVGYDRLIVALFDTTSSYRLEQCSPGQAPRIMNIQFQVDGDGIHMPVVLASMISKYTRELLMTRFKAWFAHRAPQIKPTAGYGQDAKRFWQELQPILPELAIQPQQLRRCL